MVTAITAGLFLFSCSNSSLHADAGRIQSWTTTLTELDARIKELENERMEARSYVETAEVYQVTRSAEEKARQLMNLNAYVAAIDLKLDSARRLIRLYEDSIQSRSKP